MSGFAGGGGAGGPPGPGGCASDVFAGYVQMGTQAQVDQRVALGATGCPLVIRPDRNRLKVITVGSGIQLLNQVGAYPNNAGFRAIDWQAYRTANTQVAAALYSTAVGQSNTVILLSNRSVAVGYNNTLGYIGVFPAPDIPSPFSVAVGSGNVVRGTNSVAIGSTSLAMAANVVAIGSSANVTAADGIAIGRASAVAIGGTRSIAIGQGSGAAGADSVALGPLAQTTGAFANAFGRGAVARPARTTNITSPIVTRRDNGELIANADLYFSGANILIMFPEVDYSVLAEYDLTLFGGLGGAHIWLEEVGVILTTLGAPVVTQPTVRFGNVAIRNKYMGPTLCTLLTALRARDRFQLMQVDDPEVSLNFGITVPIGAPGPNINYVRPYFRGHIIEDE